MATPVIFPTSASSLHLENAYYVPARVLRIDLDRPIVALPSFDETRRCSYTRAVAFVHLHTQPIGAVELTFDEQGLDAISCTRQIWAGLHEQINAHLRMDGLGPIQSLDSTGLPSHEEPCCQQARAAFLERAPFVSVIVPTHNRIEDLRHSLPPLLALRYPDYEVIVVDSAPSSNAGAELVQRFAQDEPRLRYIREERPGVSWARNAGMNAARGAILAFTDDDTQVDPNWLLELARTFEQGAHIGCVTGQVQPMELETVAQYWCEENAGQRWFQPQNDPLRRFQRRVFSRQRRHHHLYRIGLFGCGANMAFRADALRAIQGFDPALGGRGPARCGQDIAAFFHVLMRGYTIIYEPAALIYHCHRRSYVQLRKQFYNYGVGMTAYLTKNVYEHPDVLVDLITKVPRDLLFARSTGTVRSAYYPRELARVSWRGMLYGPLAYIVSRWAAHRDGMQYRRSYPLTKEMECSEKCSIALAKNE